VHSHFRVFFVDVLGVLPNCAYKKQWYASPSIICLAFGLKIAYVGKGKVFLRTSIFCLFHKKIILLRNNILKVTAMARPIKETPILTGKDAERFVERAERVEKMSKEVRATNHAKLMERVKEAKKLITFCW
jgi:hypothetical protein